MRAVRGEKEKIILPQRKELGYYLGLRYPFTVYPDAGGGFVAEIKELPGCITQAETLDELSQRIEDARQLWIKTAYDDGQNIPSPINKVQSSPKLESYTEEEQEMILCITRERSCRPSDCKECGWTKK